MIDSKPTQVEGELNKCPPSHQKKTAAQTTVLYLLYVPPNAGSCILTPSCLLGGCPHSLFCHPLHNEGSTYYEDIRVPFKVM